MKKVWLILFILVVLQFAMAELSAVEVTIGAGNQQALIPFNFYYYYSLYETLYYPDEIQTVGIIDTIKYYNNFSQGSLTQNIQIWMGETTQPDLSQSWIPSSQLTLVFDGTMIFPPGQNVIAIPLTVPYVYTGTNLVIMTRNPYMSAMIGPEYFLCQTVGTNRARSFYSDTTNPDPGNPPTTGSYYSLTGQFPKTTLNFVTTMWHDLTAVSITGNPTPIQFIPSPYLVTILNSGDYYQSQYTVKLFNTANQELASVPGTPLNPGQTAQIPIPWTPLIIENTGIYGKVVMADDAFSFNNQTAVLNIAVQPGGVIIDPPPPDIYTRVPVDMYYQNSLFETIFSENYWYLYNIPSPCYITTVSFYNNFVTTILNNMPTKVWLGNTTQTNLTTGWIPSTQLTPVFNGTINYPPSQNSINITLQTPFLYTGGNLVMMVNRPMDTQYYSSNDVFACYYGTADCARKLYSDTIVFDPASPLPGNASLSNVYPMTSFFYSEDGFGSLSGIIRNSQNQSIAGAAIQIAGLEMNTTSDSLGAYSFAVVQEGAYQVSAAKPGFVTTTQTAVITDENNTVLDFILPYASNASINGRVVNSLAPGLGISGAQITMSGFYNATAITGVGGNFVLYNIPSNHTYTIVISKDGYQSSTITVQLDNFDINLGNLPLVEIAVAPNNVQAVANAQNTGFNITWSPPYRGHAVVRDASSVANPFRANASAEANRTLTGYKVWRLEQGQQNNPELWTLITPSPITATAYSDSYQNPNVGTWERLWAVKAIYTGNQYSPPAFSNSIIGGLWAGIIEGTITNNATGLPVSAALVSTNPAMNQTLSDAEGHFSLIRPPDSYILSVTADNYEPFQQEGIGVTDGDTTTVDIALAPIVHNPEEPVFIKATMLRGCYPNPFAFSTTIGFDIKEPVPACLEIHNIKGQRIKSLVNDVKKSGSYSVVWNGTDNNNQPVANGVYFLRMTAGKYTAAMKVVLLR